MSLLELTAPPSAEIDNAIVETVPARKGRQWEITSWFAGTFAGYMTVAALLVFRYHVILGDAMSRVDNSSYVLYGRDPHLAAIGFVWNPLPSLLALPILVLKPLLPVLLTDGFAGNIVSAFLMAGAVAVVAATCRDLGLGPMARTALVAAFALNPMIVYYGANGMSEAAFILSVVWATKGTLRFVRHGQTSGLVSAGAALAVGYMARYEAAVCAAGVVTLVLLVSWWRGRDRDLKPRLQSAALDGAIVAGPPAVVIAGWALASWIIVGSPFSQFTSQYGNSAQLAEAGVKATNASAGLPHLIARFGEQILSLEPLVGPVLILALVVAVTARTVLPLVPAAACLSVLAFEAAAAATGNTFGWLRFGILVIPLCTMTAAVLVAELAGRHQVGWSWTNVSFTASAVFVLLPAYATTVAAWGNARLAPEESCAFGIVRHLPPPACQPVLFTAETKVAQFFDRQHLPSGSVLMDVAEGYSVFSRSDDPRQFVITPDRDFQQILADPPTFHIRYIVTVAPVGLGEADAINIAYPGIYNNGAGLGTLVGTYASPPDTGSPTYRIYRVTATSAIAS